MDTFSTTASPKKRKIFDTEKEEGKIRATYIDNVNRIMTTCSQVIDGIKKECEAKYTPPEEFEKMVVNCPIVHRLLNLSSELLREINVHQDNAPQYSKEYFKIMPDEFYILKAVWITEMNNAELKYGLPMSLMMVSQRKKELLEASSSFILWKLACSNIQKLIAQLKVSIMETNREYERKKDQAMRKIELLGFATECPVCATVVPDQFIKKFPCFSTHFMCINCTLRHFAEPNACHLCRAPLEWNPKKMEVTTISRSPAQQNTAEEETFTIPYILDVSELIRQESSNI